jgi:hypothetical protein
MTQNRKLAAFTLAAHAVIFTASLSWLRSLKDHDVGAVAWSHRYYYDFASQALSGRLPYRDFPFEYPVLSFPLFLIPRLLASNFGSYQVAFVAEMFLFDVAAIVLLARPGCKNEEAVPVARRLGWYTLYCFLLLPLVIGRFELAPMVFAFAAANWWFSGRNVPGGITAGLGTLMKVFPGVIAAPALVCELTGLRVTRARGSAAFLVTLAVGIVIWFGIGGSHVIESLEYHAQRGLEIESLYGGSLFLVGTLTGTAAPWVFDHNAYHLAPAWGAPLARLAFPIQFAALLLVMARFWRSSMTEGIRYSAAAVLAFIITGKVLSPQYLIWLFPFLVVLPGRKGRLARRGFLLCCLTTTLIYPGPGFPMILDHQPGAILLLNLRNVLLLWLLALLLFGASGRDRPPAQTQKPSESPITDADRTRTTPLTTDN